jgi:hypothetical protein
LCGNPVAKRIPRRIGKKRRIEHTGTCRVRGRKIGYFPLSFILRIGIFSEDIALDIVETATDRAACLLFEVGNGIPIRLIRRIDAPVERARDTGDRIPFLVDTCAALGFLTIVEAAAVGERGDVAGRQCGIIRSIVIERRIRLLGLICDARIDIVFPVITLLTIINDAVATAWHALTVGIAGDCVARTVLATVRRCLDAYRISIGRFTRIHLMTIGIANHRLPVTIKSGAVRSEVVAGRISARLARCLTGIIHTVRYDAAVERVARPAVVDVTVADTRDASELVITFIQQLFFVGRVAAIVVRFTPIGITGTIGVAYADAHCTSSVDIALCSSQITCLSLIRRRATLVRKCTLREKLCAKVQMEDVLFPCAVLPVPADTDNRHNCSKSKPAGEPGDGHLLGSVANAAADRENRWKLWQADPPRDRRLSAIAGSVGDAGRKKALLSREGRWTSVLVRGFCNAPCVTRQSLIRLRPAGMERRAPAAVSAAYSAASSRALTLRGNSPAAFVRAHP